MTALDLASVFLLYFCAKSTIFVQTALLYLLKAKMAQLLKLSS